MNPKNRHGDLYLDDIMMTQKLLLGSFKKILLKL